MNNDYKVSRLESTNMDLCNCIGPQNGDPVCPCRMKHMKVVNGRYVEEIDHGPASEISLSESAKKLLLENQ